MDLYVVARGNAWRNFPAYEEAHSVHRKQVLMSSLAPLFFLLQREHSTRVYKQALEVYQGRGWTLAEVQYS